MIYGALGNVIYAAFQTAPGSLQSLGDFQKYQFGQLNLAFIFFIFVGAMATSKIGIKLGTLVSDRTRKNSIIALMFLLGVKSLFF